MAFRCNFFISKCLYINDKECCSEYLVPCLSSHSEVRCKQQKGLVAGITKLVVMWRQWSRGARLESHSRDRNWTNIASRGHRHTHNLVQVLLCYQNNHRASLNTPAVCICSHMPPQHLLECQIFKNIL